MRLKLPENDGPLCGRCVGVHEFAQAPFLPLNWVGGNDWGLSSIYRAPPPNIVQWEEHTKPNQISALCNERLAGQKESRHIENFAAQDSGGGLGKHKRGDV